eukprot:Colp12_sorted_trinity150504_noHs@27466
MSYKRLSTTAGDDDEVPEHRFETQHRYEHEVEVTWADDKTPLLGQSFIDDEAPLDRYNLAYWIFFIQGIGMLFPWNMFINGESYFRDRFEGSKFETNFENYFTSVFQASNIIVLFLVMKIQHKLNVRSRIMYPLLVQLAVFIVTTVLVKLPDLDQTSFFGITMVCVAVAGSATAFLQGGLFGLSGVLPPKYVQGLMGGQGLGGVFVALSSVITISTTDDQYKAAFVYFLVSVLVLALCLVSYLVLLKLPIVQYYSHIHRPKTSGKDVPVKVVWGKVWREALLVFYIFVVTLAVFPSISSSVKSSTKSDNIFFGKLFVPIYCFITYNVGDWIGRTAAGWWQWPLKTVAIPVLLRSLLVVGFMFCNIPDSDLPIIFEHDAWPMVFMVLLSVTNGYFASVLMMGGPTLVE